MRLSVSARLALLAIALVLISNFALTAFIWQRTHGDAVGRLRRDTIERSEALAAIYRDAGLAGLRGAVDEAGAGGDDALLVALVDARGRRLAGSGPARVEAPLAATGFRTGPLGAGRWSRDAGFAILPVEHGWLLVGRRLDDWQQAERTIERALVLSVVLSLLLGVGGGLILTRYVGRRVGLIADAVDTVAGGDLSRRVAIEAGGEDAFDRLGSRINMMLDKIERLMVELRLVTDSLAHDLRSPLARLRAKAESALVEDPVQRETALGGLLAETDLVMRMLTVLIEISRSESVPRDRFVPVAPAELIEEIADFYAPVVEDAGLSFAVAADATVPTLTLHRELMSQALANLIDNAIRHGAGGDAITLRLLAGAGEVRFQVEDHGPGIAAADRARALSRFGRLDDARSLPGAGLGLSLVQAVAKLHGGRLELGDNAPGLIVAMALPIG